MQPVCKRISVLKRPWFRALEIFPTLHILQCINNLCWSSITISCVLKQSGKLIRFDKSNTDSHFATKPTCSPCYSACNLENRIRMWWISKGYDMISTNVDIIETARTSSSVTHLLETSFWEY
jgi:hypothetical protein